MFKKRTIEYVTRISMVKALYKHLRLIVTSCCIGKDLLR